MGVGWMFLALEGPDGSSLLLVRMTGENKGDGLTLTLSPNLWGQWQENLGLLTCLSVLSNPPCTLSHPQEPMGLFWMEEERPCFLEPAGENFLQRHYLLKREIKLSKGGKYIIWDVICGYKILNNKN